MSRQLVIHLVDPARLLPGVWCPEREKTIGRGDILASYSGERIAYGQTVLWVGVGQRFHAGKAAEEAYRLECPEGFDGEPVSYREKTRDAESARQNPLGFYHGMIVTHDGMRMVLCGPPAIFAPGQAEQMDLFGPTSRSFIGDVEIRRRGRPGGRPQTRGAAYR